jgi:monovalent cation/hydrogen antiporter
VSAWSGMQGTVSLAVALALPSTTTRGGKAFPQRTLIMSPTLAVIFVTFAGQGLTRPAPDPPPGPG